MSRKLPKTVSFDSSGNLAFVRPYMWEVATKVPNFQFEDVLTFVGHERSAYSTKFVFKTSTGFLVRMYLLDFMKAVPMMTAGEVWGKWTFCKIGAGFGVCLV